MKKALLAFSAVLMMVSFTSKAFAYDCDGYVVAPSGQTLYYNYIISTHTIEITSPSNDVTNPWYGGTGPVGNLVIPSIITHNGAPRPVTSISSYAFKGCAGITSITIHDTISSIGSNAFQGCANLTAVYYGGSVADWCGIVFGNHVGNPLFHANHLYIDNTLVTDLIIPDSVTEIRGYAFFNCTDLTHITIGRNVTSIGDGAFYGCTGVTSVVCNAENCTGAGSPFSPSFGNCVNITSFNFGSNVTQIPAYVCYQLTGLTTVTMPGGVTAIGNQAFLGCLGLTSVSVGANTLTITSNDTTKGKVYIDFPLTTSWNHKLFAKAYDIADHHHVEWGDGCISTTDTIILAENVDLMATFAPDCYSLNVNVYGDTSIVPVTFPVGNIANYGDTLIVVAHPIEHYHVTNWSGSGILAISTDKDTVWVVMNSNRTITCYYNIDVHTVSVLSSNTDQGNVVGGGEFNYGESCHIEARAKNGYRFDHWSDGSTEQYYTIVVTSDTTLTAYFVSTQGVEDVIWDGICVFSCDGRIVVEGINNNVQIFDIMGRNIRNESLNNGIYIVKVGNLPARKIMVIR